MQFVNASTLYRHHEFDIDQLCTGRPINNRNIFDKNTVIEVNEHPLHQDWNYCTFNERFRLRFQKVQVHQYGRQQRPESEFWIAVHFRWGDLQNEFSLGRFTPRKNDVEHPDFRAGRGLSTLAHDAMEYLKVNPGARVFLISEGERDEFQAFRTIIPTTEFMLNETWRDALWTISQSNVAIGGISSFFAVGAHLCNKCTVVTITNNTKFKPHMEEQRSHQTHFDMEWLKT